MIVIDANILIRAVLGRRVRGIIETYSGPRSIFFTPDVAFSDAEKYLPLLLKKFDKPRDDVRTDLEYLRQMIKVVDHDVYGVFEQQARLRLHGRDEEDWPVLASALALSCGIWTEDTDFFGTGIPVWTTNRVEIFLKSEAKCSQAEEE
jgi:predicted nucleic acid-binding protein